MGPFGYSDTGGGRATGSRAPSKSVSVTSWSEAHAYLDKGKGQYKDQRPIQRNTRLFRKLGCSRRECFSIRKFGFERDCYSVVLHNTAVVTYHCDGGVELNTGGWDTQTTWARIREFTPRWLMVGSDRRYIPLAERMEIARRWHVREDEEELKEYARGMTKTETIKKVWLHVGYVPWTEGQPSYWQHEEELLYEDGIVVFVPEIPDYSIRGIDTDQDVEHKLARSVRGQDW